MRHPSEAGEHPHPEPIAHVEKTIEEGRSNATPFLLIGGVAMVVWSIVALVSVATLLIWSLV